MRPKTTAQRRGILAAGNWIIDQVKIIDVYPNRDQLANIRREEQGTGGAAYNVLLDLARLDPKLPLSGAGLVGKDPMGAQILQDCKQHRIDTTWLESTSKAPTSYTDVMTEEKGGRRTFFHQQGANSWWDGKGIDFARSHARLFHLGYLLLLDSIDAADAKYGTVGARLLARAQAAGLKTSIDVVSEEGERFAKIVLPALKFVDYCILNEIEAGKTTNFKIRQADGRLDTVALRHAAGALLQHGVRDLVVIHFPEGGFARTRKGEDIWQSSVKLSESRIAGTAGAGDAFCAGVLLGLHEGWDLQKCLKTGVCVAAASLSHPTCTGGVGSLASALSLGKRLGFRANLES